MIVVGFYLKNLGLIKKIILWGTTFVYRFVMLPNVGDHNCLYISNAVCYSSTVSSLTDSSVGDHICFDMRHLKMYTERVEARVI